MQFIFCRKKKLEKEGSEILSRSDSLKEVLSVIHTKTTDKTFVKLITGGSRRKNEVAAKQILVIPILRALGYDDTDESCVMPEWLISVDKHPNKVDYAISDENKLYSGDASILLEAKAFNVDLDTPRHGVTPTQQLERYFNNTPSARIGILSNGREFRFFCQTVENLFGQGTHSMCSEPILVIKTDAEDYEYNPDIEHFRKGQLNIAEMPIVKDRTTAFFTQNLDKETLRTAVAEACASIVSQIKHNAQCGDLLTDDEVYNIIVDALN